MPRQKRAGSSPAGGTILKSQTLSCLAFFVRIFVKKKRDSFKKVKNMYQLEKVVDNYVVQRYIVHVHD